MHLPGKPRDEFTEWLDENNVLPSTPSEHERSLVAAVQGCSDILPGSNCQWLDIPRGSTYAQAAQEISQMWGLTD